MRSGGWIILGIGLAATALGIVDHFISHRLGELGVIYMAEGAAGVMLGAASVLWAPKQMRRNLMRLNNDHANDRFPPIDLR